MKTFEILIESIVTLMTIDETISKPICWLLANVFLKQNFETLCCGQIILEQFHSDYPHM